MKNNSRWSYDRGKGLSLKRVTFDDNGVYYCVGEMNNIRSKEKFTVIVYGSCKVQFIWILSNLNEYSIRGGTY